MRIFVQHRDQLRRLGTFLADEFDALVTRIRSTWTVEHNEDGNHVVLTSDPTDPRDDTWWLVRNGGTVNLKARVNGVTQTLV